MRRRLKPSEWKRMDRMFWIVLAIAIPLLLVLTLLDAYFIGFK